MNFNIFETYLDSRNVSLSVVDSDIDSINKQIQAFVDQSDFSNPEYISLTRQLTKKTNLKALLEKYFANKEQFIESEELKNDPEMKEMAEAEIEKLSSELESITKTIRELTAIELKYDSNNAIFEIRPGVGGVEAALFAETLYKMYVSYCNAKNIRVEQFSLDYDDEGGIKEAVFLADGEDTYKLFRFESGVHRVQRVPTTESAGRIHTSTASVVVLPEVQKTDVEIKDEDLRIDVYRSSGPGGQSVNTTDSAVRITHIPTGITVACQNGKSQHKNKDMAMSILASKLAEIEEEKRLSKERSARTAAISGGDRSAKIRTYNFPQGRVTDHRIQKSWFNIEQIVNGAEIEEVIKTVSNTLRSELAED